MAERYLPIVAYYRVSTQRQGASGLGLEAQRAAVREYAASRNQQLIAEFEEIESGKLVERPKLRDALVLAKQVGGCIVVAKLDRLARDASFVLGLRAAGVEFAAVDMPHANRLVIGIMALIAEYEGEQISHRTRVALAAAKARGVKLGGDRGQTFDKATAVRKANIRERHDRIRDRVLAAYAIEGSLRETAKTLNDTYVPTPSGQGTWHAGTVGRFLQREKIEL